MNNQWAKIARHGKVNIEKAGNSIRLRWTDLSSTRVSMAVCSVDTTDSISLAQFKAAEIDADMAKESMGIEGSYDYTLEKYRFGTIKKRLLSNLFDIWQRHKELSSSTTPASTKRSVWAGVDNAFKRLPKELFLPASSGRIVRALEKHYSAATLDRYLADVVKATNDWAEEEKVDNPWKNIRSQLKKKKKQLESRTKKAWKRHELNHIRESFEKHHYYSFVSFLILTGCRPEEAIALEWKDVSFSDRYLEINKAYTAGELKGTKTGVTRTFPMNEQLIALLIPERRGKNHVVFPSPKGEYIVQSNFNSRHFKPKIRELFREGKITQDMPCYNLRNSWITLMLKEGIDIATVAKLAGTSEGIIIKNYWSSDSSVVLPAI